MSMESDIDSRNRVVNLQSTELKGHQAAVLCLDHSSRRSNHQPDACEFPALLLSGSEDGTARIWDLRSNNNRAEHCIQAGGEVMSVAFGQLPASADQPGQEDKANSDTFSRPYSIFLATGSCVYEYDLRNAKSPILRMSDDQEPLLTAGDEINQIAIVVATAQQRPKSKKKKSVASPSAKTAVWLAAASDAGTVQLAALGGCPTATSKGNVMQINHGETADGMVTAMAIRSRIKHGCFDLACGGTDCRVTRWDVHEKTCRRTGVQQFTPTQENANQICNPPMVHTVSWSPSGRLAAAGLGDGSLYVLQTDSRSWVPTARHEAHGGSIASVIFPGWLHHEDGSTHNSANDRLVATAGNDCVVALWDLGAVVGGEHAVDPCTLWQKAGENTGMSEVDTVTQIMKIGTKAKPNWMISGGREDAAFPSTLFVADTTPQIQAYTIR